MRIIKISANDNGSHDNLNSASIKAVPNGWAYVPPTLATPNFPFGTFKIAEINGVMTITSWTAGVMPEPEPTPEPRIDDITALQLAVAELAETQAADQTANELALAELAEIAIGG